MNDVQRNRILELFESNFEDGNIKEYFNKYEVIYPDIMPILKEEGYNVEAINDHTQLSKIDFEAMKVDACPAGEACPMIALLVNAGNAHFVGTPKVVTSTHPHLVGE